MGAQREFGHLETAVIRLAGSQGRRSTHAIPGGGSETLGRGLPHATEPSERSSRTTARLDSRGLLSVRW